MNTEDFSEALSQNSHIDPHINQGVIMNHNVSGFSTDTTFKQHIPKIAKEYNQSELLGNIPLPREQKIENNNGKNYSNLPLQQQQQLQPQHQHQHQQQHQQQQQSNFGLVNMKNGPQNVYIDSRSQCVTQNSTNNLNRTSHSLSHIPNQGQWTTQQNENTTTAPNNLLASSIVSAENANQVQMLQLRQIQATYGNIQNNISKKIDNDELLREKHISSSISPNGLGNIIDNMTPSASVLHNNGQHTIDSTANSSNVRVIRGMTTSSNPLMNSLEDTNHLSQQAHVVLQTHHQQQQQQQQTILIQQHNPLINQTIQNRVPTNQQAKQTVSSQSSQATPVFQDSLNHTPIQQNFNFSSNTQQHSLHYKRSIDSLMQQQQYSNQKQLPNNIQNEHQNPDPSKSSSGKIPYNIVLSEEVRRNLSNIAIVRFLRFSDLITCRHEKPNLPYLKEIVNDFFDNDANLNICLRIANENKKFSVSYSLIPLLYVKYLENVQMFEFTQKFLNATVLPDLSMTVQTDHFSFKCVFEDGSYCNHFGSLKVNMNKSLKFQEIDLLTDYNVSGLEFAALDKFMKEFKFQNKATPEMDHIKSHFKCISNLTKFGLREDLLRLMQISDVMTLSKPLINHFIKSNSTSMLEALDTFNRMNIASSEKVKMNNCDPEILTKFSQSNITPHELPSKNFQGQQQPVQIAMHARSHQGSLGSIYSRNGNDIAVGKTPMDQNSPNNHNNEINYGSKSTVPIKRLSNDAGPAPQIVVKTSNKKFKLQAPPPPKAYKKRKDVTKTEDSKHDSSTNELNAENDHT